MAHNYRTLAARAAPQSSIAPESVPSTAYDSHLGTSWPSDVQVAHPWNAQGAFGSATMAGYIAQAPSLDYSDDNAPTTLQDGLGCDLGDVKSNMLLAMSAIEGVGGVGMVHRYSNPLQSTCKWEHALDQHSLGGKSSPNTAWVDYDSSTNQSLSFESVVPFNTSMNLENPNDRSKEINMSGPSRTGRGVGRSSIQCDLGHNISEGQVNFDTVTWPGQETAHLTPMFGSRWPAPPQYVQTYFPGWPNASQQASLQYAESYSTASYSTEPSEYDDVDGLPETLRLSGGVHQDGAQSSVPPTAQRIEEDRILLEGKEKGLTYKTIRKMMQSNIAESTLRGRYRSLTKEKKDRVRKPTWTNKDVSPPSPLLSLK